MSVVFRALCIAVLIATASAQSTTSTGGSYTSIVAEGASTLVPLFQNLVFSFRDVDTSSRVSYVGSGSGAGRKAIIAGKVDFAGSNTLFTTSEVAGKPKLWSLLSSMSALVMAYNVPEVPSSKQLILDRQTAVDIYTNKIQWWNDTALATLNPGINLPNKTIKLVYRTDGSGTTNTFLQALTAFDPTASLKVGDTFNWAFSSDTKRALPASGNSQGSFRVSLNPYSIGYMSASFAIGLPYFKMINKNGKIVSATSSAVQAAVAYGVAAGSKNLTTTASLTSPLGNLANTIDAAGDDAWPMAEFDFYLIPDKINADCFKSLQIAQFLMWSIRSPTAIDAMLFLRYIPITGDALKTILSTIAQTKCGDGSQLVFDTFFPYEKAIIGFAIALSVVCVVISFLIAWKASHPMVARVGAWRLGLMSWGFAINLYTAYLWIGFPTQPICAARPWVSAISFIFVFGMIVSQMHDRVVNKKKYLRTDLYDGECNSEEESGSQFNATKSDHSEKDDASGTNVTISAPPVVLELENNVLRDNANAAAAITEQTLAGDTTAHATLANELAPTDGTTDADAPLTPRSLQRKLSFKDMRQRKNRPAAADSIVSASPTSGTAASAGAAATGSLSASPVSTGTATATVSDAGGELSVNPLFRPTGGAVLHGGETRAADVAATAAPAQQKRLASMQSSEGSRRKRLAFTESGSGIRSGVASSYTSKTTQGSDGESQVKLYDAAFRSFGILLVILINLIIPIIWVSSAPPTEEYRSCTGAYSETFRQVMIFYNLFLIGTLAMSVAASNRVQESSYPAHILVLVTALFVPLQFVQKGDNTDSLPSRTPLMIILSPAVGVLVSTMLSMLLIVGPPLYSALTMSVEEAIDVIAVEKELDRVRMSLGVE